MNKVLRRIIVLIPAVLIQLLWLYVFMRWLSPYAALINLLLSLFAILYVLYIITNRNESTYKTLWLLVILGLPVFGTILYCCFGNKRTGSPLQKKMENGQALLPAVERTTPKTLSELGEQNPRLAQTFRYVEKKTGFLSTQTQCKKRTLDNIGVSFKKWVVNGVLRIFAPLC